MTKTMMAGLAAFSLYAAQPAATTTCRSTFSPGTSTLRSPARSLTARFGRGGLPRRPHLRCLAAHHRLKPTALYGYICALTRTLPSAATLAALDT